MHKGMIRRICVVAFIAFGVSLALMISAKSRDLGQWDNADPQVRQWYQSLKQPDDPLASCCGEADAYWADHVEVKDGQVIATITDDRPDEPLGRRHVPPGTKIVVPPNKVVAFKPNPTGHVVIFLRAMDLSVLCFVQNGGV